MIKNSSIEKVIDIAVNAGNIIMKYYDKEIDIQYKEDKSPVTKADFKASKYIIAELSKLFPKDVIISEEEEYAKDQISDFWIIDPLDGTKSFVRKHGIFTVNIAHVKNNTPVFGVIYSPLSQKIYYNKSKDEAYLIDLQNNTTTQIHTDKATHNLIITSNSTSHTRFDNISDDKIFYESILTVSSSIKFCFIAEGKAHIYPRFGQTMEWDTAAGQAILEAAGGLVLDLSGNELTYGKPGFENHSFIALSSKSLIKHLKF